MSGRLSHACRSGNDDLVESILASGNVDINSCDGNFYHNTPMHYAMGFNHINIVTRLLSCAQTKLDVTNKYGKTSLHFACASNCTSGIRILGRDYRCTPAILNMKNNDGDSALMSAVAGGHLESVREMSSLDGVDFDTRNREGETLLDVARRNNHAQIIQLLEQRNNVQDAAEVARNSNTLGNVSLRDIGDEIDNIEAIQAVMISEKQILQERHRKEITRRSEEQKSELDNFIQIQKEEIDTLIVKQKEEMDELERIVLDNKRKKIVLEKKMQARFTTSTNSSPPAPSPDVPECPVCFEDMKPPIKIYNCTNGHLICADCKDRVTMCTNCREPYMGRATAVEQMLRQMFNCQ